MLSLEKRRIIQPWVAMGFCAVLSIITITSNIWLSFVNHSSVGSWSVVFLAFLPMCFFYVGAAISHVQGEVSELRQEIAKLRADRPA